MTLKKHLLLLGISFSSMLVTSSNIFAQVSNDALKIIIIRHGEKPKNGDNLNCQGLNRAVLLPAVIISKFGIPTFSYVPSLSADSATKHARMFQTITPLAVKYNLVINSKFNGKDSAGVVGDILKRQGIVFVVWDHKSILPIVHAFGINDVQLKWNDDDFDSIWIISFKNDRAVLNIDRENINPSPDCK